MWRELLESSLLGSERRTVNMILVLVVVCTLATKAQAGLFRNALSIKCQLLRCPVAPDGCQMDVIKDLRGCPATCDYTCGAPWCALRPCNLICNHGYRQDAAGCDTCQCACSPSPRCPSDCPGGYLRDSNDCPTCDCLPHTRHQHGSNTAPTQHQHGSNTAQTQHGHSSNTATQHQHGSNTATQHQHGSNTAPTRLQHSTNTAPTQHQHGCHTWAICRLGYCPDSCKCQPDCYDAYPLPDNPVVLAL